MDKRLNREIRSNTFYKYIEAVIYCIMLVLCVVLATSKNGYINLFPVVMILGICGQYLIGKRTMTSIFVGLLSIVYMQTKYPAFTTDNIIISMVLFAETIFGEITGLFLKKFIHVNMLRKSERRNKNLKTYMLIAIASAFMGMWINSLLYGNIVTYYMAKNSLIKYFSNEYSSKSRFEIDNIYYVGSDIPKYLFYCKDTRNDNKIEVFSVLRNGTVWDNKKISENSNIVSKINEQISQVTVPENFKVEVLMDKADCLYLKLRKDYSSLNKEKIELTATEIANYLKSLEELELLSKIEQIQIDIIDKSDSKNNIFSTIFVKGYEEMLNNGEESEVNYILRALNVEYFE